MKWYRGQFAADPGWGRILALEGGDWQSALTRAPRLTETPRLHAPAFWQAQIRARPGVDFAVEVLKALEKEKLLTALSPRLRGPALNWPLLTKAGKASQLLAEAGLKAPSFALFLYLLLRKLPPREQAQLAKRIVLDKKQWQATQVFEAGVKRLARDILGKEGSRPGQLYKLLSAASPDLLLLLLIESSQKQVVSSIQTYLKKYLPLRAQLPEKELQEMGVAPGTGRYQKILEAFFAELLRGRIHTRTQQMKLLHKLAQTIR